MSGVKGTFNKSTEILPCCFVPPRLRKRSFCSKVEQFHLCPGWKEDLWGRGRGGGNLTFSAGRTAIAISGSYLCLKKAAKKGTPLDWHTVAGRLRNGDKREATTQEMTLRNCRGTFTEPNRAAERKTGYSYGDRRRGSRGSRREAVLAVWGNSGIKCGGVWEKVETDEERMKALSLTGVGQKKLCVNRDVASHYNA